MHEQFLAAGVAVAGIDVGEAYGSPEGRELFTALYRELTERRGLRRPAVPARAQSRRPLGHELGRSRIRTRSPGIAGIYPVFDLRSYPGTGQGRAWPTD